MSIFSEKIKELNRDYETAVNEAKNYMNGLSKYSDEEIIKRRKEKLKNLDSVTADYNKKFGETVQQFLDVYALELPDDGKDHAADISNALQVISLLGHNLDIKNLNNIIKPMAKDFKSVKTVCDLILTLSADISVPEIAYSPDVVKAVLDYSGANSGISDYTERLKMLEDVRDSADKYRYTFNGALGDKVVNLTATITYSAMSTADWINEATVMYNGVTNSFKR